MTRHNVPFMTILERLRAAHTGPALTHPVLPLHLQAQLAKPLVVLRKEAYATSHEPTLEMLKRANRAAFNTTEPVLITGESGTGKELVAKILLGNRPNTDFFPVNCAGLVDTLFESLMFGYLKGTFTGANTDRTGVLVAAGSGIVFLDEVAELPLNQQAKLLRAIQERQVTPVGAVVATPIKCRFVFATNQNLKEMVQAGAFRKDLYYRISTLVLSTYPLRDRPDDAALIMDKICALEGWDPIDELIPAEVIQSDGNVRALRAWMVRYLIFGDTEWKD